MLLLGDNGLAAQDLYALAGIVQLQDLSLDHNELTNIDALSGMTALGNLNLAGNGDFLSLAVAAPVLAIWPNLHGLDLASNQIVNLAPLAEMALAQVPLATLVLNHNAIHDLDELANFPDLVDIYAVDNQIENVDALQSLTSLRVVELRQNSLQNLDGLIDNDTFRGSDCHLSLTQSALSPLALEQAGTLQSLWSVQVHLE